MHEQLVNLFKESSSVDASNQSKLLDYQSDLMNAMKKIVQSREEELQIMREEAALRKKLLELQVQKAERELKNIS